MPIQKPLPTKDELLKLLFAFWEAYHKIPQQMAKWCPFEIIYGEFNCIHLCYSFELLDTGLHTNMEDSCPCVGFGYEGALQRLEEVLRIGGYYLDMKDARRSNDIT